MATSLAVTADRGLVRFTGISEEYMGTSGMTILGQIDKLQKETAKENRNDSTATASSANTNPPKERNRKPPELTLMPRKSRSTPTSRAQSPGMYSPPVPAIPNEKSVLDRRAEKAQKLGKRRSLLAIFGK